MFRMGEIARCIDLSDCNYNANVRRSQVKLSEYGILRVPVACVFLTKNGLTEIFLRIKLLLLSRHYCPNQ